MGSVICHLSPASLDRFSRTFVTEREDGTEEIMSRNCSKGTVSGPLRNQTGVGFLRADCKKLSCPRCGPKKARRYRRAIGDAAEKNRLTRLMTLTLDPNKCAVEDSVAHLRQCFSKFRVSLLRRVRKRVSFIAIVELQKSGMAHLHVLIGVFLEQHWISEAWQAVGGGKIVDIRYVDVHRVNAYLTKYLTKDLLLSVPAKKKRVSTSRDINLFGEKEPSGWSWSRDLIGGLFLIALKNAERVIEIKEDDGGLCFFAIAGGP